jgi:hypothetical protein
MSARVSGSEHALLGVFDDAAPRVARMGISGCSARHAPEQRRPEPVAGEAGRKILTAGQPNSAAATPMHPEGLYVGAWPRLSERWCAVNLL